jgi:ribosomal protein L18E
MRTSNLASTLRRSSRVPMTMPITITSLEPTADFFEVCETLVVNAHGCALRSPIKLEAGHPLQFRGSDGRQTTAHVVDCQPIGSNQPGWKVAARLDLPGNFWGLPSCPDDWMRLTDMPDLPLQAGGNVATMPKMPMLRALVAEMVEPLQAELADLSERLSQQRQRNRFEVSLSQIPPEVEEKLWLRLREDLATQALRQSREQTEQVLKAAQSAIELKITEAQEEFRSWVREQLQAVNQQAQSLSEQTAGGMRQQLRAATEQFEQQAAAAGTRLHQQGEEFLETLLQRLGEEREGHRREWEAVQVAAASESSRLQTQLTELGRRMAELDETAHRLESGLNTRLMRMSTEIVSGARTQLENAADSLSQSLVARNAKDLSQQLEEATARLKGIQSEIADSVSESLKTHVAESIERFDKTMDDSAQRSVGRWRIALARDLNAVANILGEHFRAGTDGSERQ